MKSEEDEEERESYLSFSPLANQSIAKPIDDFPLCCLFLSLSFPEEDVSPVKQQATQGSSHLKTY